MSWLTFIAALGCGLMAGFFFAFSACVMRALGRLPAHEGIAAMQSINLAVLNRWFLGVFFGTAAACAVVAAANIRDFYLVAGGVLYLIGTFLVTMVFNVPRNNALARVVPRSAEGERLWAGYLVGWTAWNHVRTIAALAAAASLTAAALQP
jgi:uncharacterized membrane protein